MSCTSNYKQLYRQLYQLLFLQFKVFLSFESAHFGTLAKFQSKWTLVYSWCKEATHFANASD